MESRGKSGDGRITGDEDHPERGPGREGAVVLARAGDEKALGASEDHEDFLLGLSSGVAGKGQQEGEGKMRWEDKQGQREGGDTEDSRGMPAGQSIVQSGSGQARDS